jgi:hypothetical protein
MKRVSLAATIIAAILILGASAWAVSPPTIVFLGAGDVDLGNLNEGPAGAVCDFPVGGVLHVTSGAKEIQFAGQGVGFAARDAGALRFTVTNLDTGASLTVNISGPGWIGSDGFPAIGTGPWLIFEPIDQGGIRYLIGRMEFVPAPYGVHANLLAGTERNLCDAVA